MPVDGFLTFLGLLVAGYALLDEVSKLRLQLHAKRQVALLLVTFLTIAVLVLIQDPSVNIPDHLPRIVTKFVLWADSTSIGSGGISFLFIFAWAGLATLLYSKSKPTFNSITKLNLLAERLLNEGRLLELVDVIKPYIPLIRKLARRETRIQRMHFWLKAGGPFKQDLSDLLIVKLHQSEKTSKKYRTILPTFRKLGRRLVSPLSSFLPDRGLASDAAIDLEISLLGSPSLLSFLVHSRADFIPDLMSLDRLAAEEFKDNVIKRMMHAADSHLHRELKLLDIRSGNGRFAYEGQMPLLRKLILDSEFACQHGVWKPVGDETLRAIKENSNYRKALLQRPLDDNEPLHDDLVYDSIRFFEIMVNAAATHGVEYHMWLMYMSLISEELVNLHCGEVVEVSDAEFPTLAMRLVWEITNCYQDWIELYQYLDSDNYHVRAENMRAWGSASIVMCSILDYTTAIRHIVVSPCLPERFKEDRWASFVRFVGKISTDNVGSNVRKAVIKEVVTPSGYSPLGDISTELSEIHGKIDHVLRWQSDDLAAALRAAI